MKNLNWMQWTAIGLIIAAIITEIVFIFVQPLTAVVASFSFVFGCVAGYLLKKNGIVKTDKQILTD